MCSSDLERTAITVSDVCAALQKRAPLPPRPVVITFDDGFADFEEAAAVLAANRLPSTLYVTTGALGGRRRPPDMAIPEAPMLDWSQLAELEHRAVRPVVHVDQRLQPAGHQLPRVLLSARHLQRLVPVRPRRLRHVERLGRQGRDGAEHRVDERTEQQIGRAHV